MAAAREATRRLAYEEAVHHWEGALTAAVGRDVAQSAQGAAGRIETLIELGEALRRAGDGQAAADAYLRSADLARRAQPGRETAARGFAARGLAHAALGLHAIGSRMWWPPDQIVRLFSEALDALGDSDELLSLRVQANLARVLAWHRLDVPRAQALAERAVAAARAAGDQPALIACLLAQHTAIAAPGTARARHALAVEVADLATSTGDQEALLEAHLLAASDLLESAVPAFRGELGEFLRLADGGQQPRFRYAGLVRRAMLAMLAGQLAEAGRLVGQSAMLGEECGEPGVQDVRYDQGWELLTAQGRLGELASELPQMFPDPDSVPARGVRAAVLLASGARARLVIGADGKHSRVAEVVQARAYRTKPPQSLAFYTYWEAVPVTGGEMYGRQPQPWPGRGRHAADQRRPVGRQRQPVQGQCVRREDPLLRNLLPALQRMNHVFPSSVALPKSVSIAAPPVTGMCRGEALALRWRDVDLELGTVTIRRSAGMVRVALPRSAR